MTADELDEAFAGWASGLVDEEIEALRTYQAGGHAAINRLLRAPRRGRHIEREELDRLAPQILDVDRAIAAGAIPRPVVVYRGVREAADIIEIDRPRDLVGTVIADDGFLSTTLYDGVAIRFARRRTGCILRIELGPGPQAAWVALVGAARWAPQAELLLPRQLPLRVRAVRRGRSIMVIEADDRP